MYSTAILYLSPALMLILRDNAIPRLAAARRRKALGRPAGCTWQGITGCVRLHTIFPHVKTW